MEVQGTTEAMRMVMAAETPSRKATFAAQAALWMAFFAITGAIYVAWDANAQKINEGMCNMSFALSEECS